MADVRMEATDALGQALQRRDRLGRSVVELERALAAPVERRRTAWLDRVELALIGVRNAFSAHVHVTEDSEGLFDEVLAEAPRLGHQVEILRREHGELEDEIERAVHTLQRDPDVVRRALLALFARIAEHRQRGADLLYEAYDVDLGFAD